MRARDISALCAPVDDLFEAAARRGVASTGIGDGGNEIGVRPRGLESAQRRTRSPFSQPISPGVFVVSLVGVFPNVQEGLLPVAGMLKVREQVGRYIPNGPTICSATPTTHLIATGVRPSLAGPLCLSQPRRRTNQAAFDGEVEGGAGIIWKAMMGAPKSVSPEMGNQAPSDHKACALVPKAPDVLKRSTAAQNTPAPPPPVEMVGLGRAPSGEACQGPPRPHPS